MLLSSLRRRAVSECLRLLLIRHPDVNWASPTSWECLMKMSVFVGTSLDGFIARKNGEYDFLPVDGGEPHGYEEFIASVDTILIGHNTFEVVLKLPCWPYDGK